MDSKTPEVLIVSAPAADLNATGVKITLPLVESIEVTEFGFYNSAVDCNAAVLKLQVLESDNSTAQDLAVATATTATDAGKTLRRRGRWVVEKLTQRAWEGDATAALSPGGSRVFIAVNLNLTTGGDANAKGTFYLKYRKAGSQSTAQTNEQIVTS
jgi:hypothetical protein